MAKEKIPKMSEEDRKRLFRQIAAVPNDHLETLLEGNEANKEICKMITEEMAEREQGNKRIIMFEESALLGE